jgi:hypothetical protein
MTIAVLAQPTAQIAPVGPVEVRVASPLPALDDPAMVHRADGAPATGQDAARIAAALGLVGDPTDTGWGAWAVGSQDGTGPTLSLTADALGQWWYSAAPSSTVCAEPAPDGGGGAVPCRDTAPFGPLPTDTQALADAEQVHARLGGSGTGEVQRDAWAVSVTFPQLVDGVEAPIGSTYRYESAGQLAGANGVLGRFTAVEPAPRIGTAAALDLIRAGRTMPWPAVAAETTEQAPAPGQTSPGSPGLPEPAPVPMPEPVPLDLEPLVITITGVVEGLLLVPGADGTAWLLPAYRFSTADGGTIEVLAVPQDRIEVVQPTDAPGIAE